ncbi:MAG TPA: deoxyribodipyrimidine photo-lyase [Candidatus Binataceae bacterium]|nr:deoxyribodipyrimidine photo-lyase [Candidatus Binataceae bacterium]
MQRAQRAIDNPALTLAIRTANELGKPVLVFFCLLSRHPVANLRHYAFMLEGLEDTAHRLERMRIGFVLRTSGGASPIPAFVRLCAQVRPALVVTDENPLRRSNGWRSAAANSLSVPLLSVDADVIVPSALLGKEQYAARTIRPRILSQLERFLQPVHNPPVRSAWRAPNGLSSLTASARVLDRIKLERSVGAVGSFHGGSGEGMRRLRRFIRDGLRGYAQTRNHPELEGTSRLSAYLHFGHLGPHTVALAVRDADPPRLVRDAFMEQLIVRRELAINFVRFNPNYDRVEAGEDWALRTLKAHARDRRAYRYSAAQLERAETHDPLWNAAQLQMVVTGWMHGYLRMYWAKKILEWSASPAGAYRVAVRLNDKYELDGRDPNGYAGIAWAIAGKHDRAWGPERPIYGLVRYMSYASTSRKFDSPSYIAKWSRG